MATQTNKMTAAMQKLHMYGVFVLQTLVTEGKLAEDFDPMSLDTSLVFKFDPNEMKNMFKNNKKTKAAVKVVSSPRENVANTIANNHYGTNNEDDIVSQIVNATKSDVAEKPKRKPRQKKVPENALNVVTDTGDAVEPSDGAANTETVVANDKPKPQRKPRQKKVPVTEPAAVVDENTNVADEVVSEAAVVPVVAAEKPKPQRKPRQKKVPVTEPAPAETVGDEVTADTATAVPVVAAEKPKPQRKPRQKKAPVVQDVPVSSEMTNNSEKKAAAIEAVNALVAPTSPKNEPVEEPVQVDTDDNDDEEEEIQARIMNYEGKQYLLDDNMNVYDKDSYDEIGTFDADTQKITFK
jgi:hypothetical protein